MKAGGKILWEGSWACGACGRSYPQVRGIAFLAAMDHDWTTALGELVARRRITQRLVERMDWEPDRRRRRTEQISVNRDLMDHLFAEALKRLNPGPGMRILDVGSGLCSTAAAFARRGADVVATETEVSNLFHVSFAETDVDEPETLETPLITFHSRSPEKYPAYFARVVAPAHRLPFRSGTFDAVFCRSVLHHLDRLPFAIREMLRVLKPGGLFLACSEPMRSVLDDENLYLSGTVDREDGMNEQSPRLLDYWLGLRGCTRDMRVQVWPNPHRFESKRLFGKIPYNFHRHVPPGSVVRGWKLVKLLPFSASANIMATRNLFPIPVRPATVDLLPGFDAATLAAAYEPGPSIRESLQRMPSDTARLAAAWRALRAMEGGLTSAFVPGIMEEKQLRAGWRRVSVRDGVPYRHANRVAEILLFHADNPKCLELSVEAPGQALAVPPRPCSGFVRVNGTEVGRFDIAGGEGWQLLAFVLPSGAGQVLQVELVHESMPLSLVNGEPVELGLAVRWARVL